MTWKNLKTNPPLDDCYICVAFREDGIMSGYEVFSYDAVPITMSKDGKRYDPKRSTCELLYINLNEILVG